jgi:hypothetical protein
MRIAPFSIWGLATLGWLSMAVSSHAATILQFGQANPSDFVTATAVGNTTTLTTSSGVAPNSIPILITNIAGAPLGSPLAAFETFVNLSSVGTATSTAGTIEQLYSGTIAITTGANGTGGNFLTASFTNAVLTGLAGGNSASLLDSRPPNNVTFTSNFAAIVPLIAGNPPENFSIALTDVNPGLAMSGSTIASFTAQNAGGFATSIPEPATGLALASIVVGLGCVRSRAGARRSRNVG